MAKTEETTELHFESGAGMTAPGGKPRYPHLLRLEIDKKTAVGMIRLLVDSLAHGDEKAIVPIHGQVSEE